MYGASGHVLPNQTTDQNTCGHTISGAAIQNQRTLQITWPSSLLAKVPFRTILEPGHQVLASLIKGSEAGAAKAHPDSRAFTYQYCQL